MADEEYLLNKKYINTNVYNIEKNIPEYLKEQNEFRKFMENQNLDYDDINEEIDIDPDLIRQEEPISIKYEKRLKNDKRDVRNKNSIQIQSQSMGMSIPQPMIQNNKRFVIEKRHLIYIDSRDRDTSVYTEPNSYKIYLKKDYSNIVSIKLKSTEFTNSQQLIRSTPAALKNNQISWKISNDGNDVTYTTILTPGNYSASTLEKLIQDKMNSVQRISGKYNNIKCSIDIVTDIVSFSSIEYDIVSNPFTFELSNSNFTEITINHQNHGLNAGQEIYILGAMTIGGINSSNWNTNHNISEIIDIDSYKIIISAISTNAETNVGGSSVQIGKGLQFKLLFSDSNSPYSILGFPNSDTEYAVIHTNTIESFSYVEQIQVDGNGDEIPSSQEIVAITDAYLNGYQIYPLITNINGFIRVSIRKAFEPIISSESSLYTYIRTNYDHLLETGDKIYIFGESNSVYEKLTIFDHLYGTTVSALGLSNTEETNRLKFIEEICNPAGLIVTVIDSNTIKIPVPYISIPGIETYITNNVDIISDATIEFGSIITTAISQNLNLAGEKYIFMQSDVLGNGETSGNVSNIFAKLQLASESGTNIFNAYIGGYKVFEETPLNNLNQLDFKFYKNDGELFEFYDIDHSFTLELTEAIQKFEGVGFSSRIGSST
jgi:hypothetical protein